MKKYSESFFSDSLKKVHELGLELDTKTKLKHHLLINYCYLRSFFPPRNRKVKVLIFGQGRSGSTLLEDLIASSGLFRARGEIIRPFRSILKYPIRFIKGFSRHKFDENFIFHTKIYHLSYFGKELIHPQDYLESLYHDGWKIIFLFRKNTLRQCISNQIAMQSKRWFYNSDSNVNNKYYLDLENLEKQMDMRLCFLEKEQEYLKHIPHVTVNYENDLLYSKNHQMTIDRIFSFLSLPKTKISTQFKKGGKNDLKDQISNYTELVQLTRKRGWENFLISE